MMAHMRIKFKNINALLINEGVVQSERLVKLNQIAIKQITLLQNNQNRKLLKQKNLFKCPNNLVGIPTL